MPSKRAIVRKIRFRSLNRNGPGSKAQWSSIEVANGRKLLTAVLRPRGSTTLPAIVILHGGDGLDETYMAVAAEVANSGFVVVIGCWQKTNYICAEAPAPADWVADPGRYCGRELIDFARTLRGVDPARVGLYAFSRGGHAALWAASTGASVKAVVLCSGSVRSVRATCWISSSTFCIAPISRWIRALLSLA